MTVGRKHLVWAGIVAGAAAWGTSTQATYALVPVACAARVGLAIPLTAVCAAAAVAGAWVSYGAARGQPAAAEWKDARGGKAHRFAAWVGTGAGILFALTIVNQAVASIILDGCLR